MKKLLWMSKNENLRKEFEQSLYDLSLDSVIFVATEEECTHIVCDVIQLEDVSKEFNKSNITVIAQDDKKKVIKSLYLKGYNVHYSYLPVIAIIERIIGKVKSKNYQKHDIETRNEDSVSIYTFHSPKGGVGTSTIAVSSALSLAKKGKVLFIDMTKKDQLCTFVNKYDSSQGLDPVLSYFNEDSFQQDKFDTLIKRNISRTTKFDYLFGVANSNISVITQDFINKLVSSIKRMDYDYVVFDTNSETSIMNLSIMTVSTTNYIVFDSSVHSAWAVMKLYPIISKLNMISKSYLIMNRKKLSSGFSIKDIENQTGLSCVCTIKNVQYIDNGSLFYEKSNKFRRSIDKVMGG